MPKILVFLVILTIVLSAILNQVFKVKKVEFGTDACPNDVRSLQEKIIGSNILLFNPYNFTESMKPELSCIETLSIIRKYPSTVNIQITVQTPVANIEGTNYQVNKTGLIWEKTAQNTLPVIFLPSEVNVNLDQNIQNRRVLTALDITSSLLKSDFVPKSIKFVENNDVVIYDTNEIMVVFSGEKGATEQVDSLQLILSKAKIDELKITKIDLRFNKPVISAK